MGRLFDTVAALTGFVREQTFEGQAAMWLEHLARSGENAQPYPFPFENGISDYEPLLRAVIADRLAGRSPNAIARAFHAAIAANIVAIAESAGIDRIVASGGVFQNALLVEMLVDVLGDRLWLNRIVPPNDGGLSLGQAAIASLSS